MSVDISKLIKLNDMVSLSFRRKHIVVLNPEDEHDNNLKLNQNVEFDKGEWKIPDNIQNFVNGLARSNYLSNEDKILLIFERLCQDYVYDDNLISYIQKVDDESFDLPDWYGRDIDSSWEEKRKLHNRRVCYEVSRYLAKSLTELFGDNKDFNVCILWDKGLTHYFVGLTCSDYSITLDLDDFNNIKDLTRVKAGLTAQGITILSDKDGKFKSALDKFNDGKTNDAITKIENEIASASTNIESDEKNQIQDFDQEEELEDAIFFRNAIEILKDKFDIDPQGIYEYMKEIVDIKLGPESRKKVWKKIRGTNENDTRYVRCLVTNINDHPYIIDVEEGVLRPFDEKEFERQDADYIPYKKLTRDWGDRYDGS